MAESNRRRRALTFDERGSTLVLMPVGIIILLLLASVAIDFSLALHEQRELLNAASAAANDAATFGLDADAFRSNSTLSLDAARVDEAVRRSLASRQGGEAGQTQHSVRFPSPTSVQVALERRVPLRFAGSIPGAPDSIIVRSAASAALVRR